MKKQLIQTITMKHIDKNSIKHFGVNFILAGIGGLYGLSAGASASLTKEWCDYKYGKHWCWLDLAFDTLGLAAGEAVHFLMFKTV